MKTRIVLIIVVLLTWLAVVKGQPAILDKESQEVSWPEIPDGFKKFTKSHWAQSPYIMTGGMRQWSVGERGGDRRLVLEPVPSRPMSADGFNVPWHFSGGLHETWGWWSRGFVSIPKGKKIRAWGERIDAGAIEPIPVNRWAFPEGTVFADQLSTKAGVFEVRTLTKRDGSWKAKVAYQNLDNAPNGYTGAGRKCLECHQRAGTWQSYGVMAPGNDGIISPNILKSGTLTLNRDEWPIEVDTGE